MIECGIFVFLCLSGMALVIVALGEMMRGT